MPNKAFKPTPEQREAVKALKAHAVPVKEIAAYLGISSNTLSKYFQKDMDAAKLDAHRPVMDFLHYTASGKALENGATYGECIRSAIFYAKTQMGWKEEEQIPQGDTNINYYAPTFPRDG